MLLKLAVEIGVPAVVGVGVGVVGTLVKEHGVKWTVATIKGWVGRNTSSTKDDLNKAKEVVNNVKQDVTGQANKP